jgi:hypothetical protein
MITYVREHSPMDRDAAIETALSFTLSLIDGFAPEHRIESLQAAIELFQRELVQ